MNDISVHIFFSLFRFWFSVERVSRCRCNAFQSVISIISVGIFPVACCSYWTVCYVFQSESTEATERTWNETGVRTARWSIFFLLQNVSRSFTHTKSMNRRALHIYLLCVVDTFINRQTIAIWTKRFPLRCVGNKWIERQEISVDINNWSRIDSRDERIYLEYRFFFSCLLKEIRRTQAATSLVAAWICFCLFHHKLLN